MPKKDKKYYVYDKPYVYVVVEHARGDLDAKVHGIYSTKESAEGKYNSLQHNPPSTAWARGYICILKKPVEGKRVRWHKSRYDESFRLLMRIIDPENK